MVKTIIGQSFTSRFHVHDCRESLDRYLEDGWRVVAGPYTEKGKLQDIGSGYLMHTCEFTKPRLSGLMAARRMAQKRRRPSATP